jgi:hypothetical protein
MSGASRNHSSRSESEGEVSQQALWLGFPHLWLLCEHCPAYRFAHGEPARTSCNRLHLQLALVPAAYPRNGGRREIATLDGAFNQLQTYKAQISSLFRTNAALVVSDGIAARGGVASQIHLTATFLSIHRFRLLIRMHSNRCSAWHKTTVCQTPSYRSNFSTAITGTTGRPILWSTR